jgi:hypothetical protein
MNLKIFREYRKTCFMTALFTWMNEERRRRRRRRRRHAD